jgi:hypothetical protein
VFAETVWPRGADEPLLAPDELPLVESDEPPPVESDELEVVVEAPPGVVGGEEGWLGASDAGSEAVPVVSLCASGSGSVGVCSCGCGSSSNAVGRFVEAKIPSPAGLLRKRGAVL